MAYGPDSADSPSPLQEWQRQAIKALSPKVRELRMDLEGREPNGLLELLRELDELTAAPVKESSPEEWEERALLLSCLGPPVGAHAAWG